MSTVQDRIAELVKNNKVVLFMKGNPQMPQCGFSARATTILTHLGVADFAHVDVLSDPEIRQGIKEYSKWPTIPQLYVNGEFLGGSDIMMEQFENGELAAQLQA
jgi:monothiol glutaredoxin